MGKMFYGQTDRPIEVDDLTLAHAQAVIATKLRRGESFTLSWKHAPAQRGGRSTVWVHSSIPLRFEFDAELTAPLDRGLIEAFAEAANSNRGLDLSIADSFVSARDVDHVVTAA